MKVWYLTGENRYVVTHGDRLLPCPSEVTVRDKSFERMYAEVVITTTNTVNLLDFEMVKTRFLLSYDITSVYGGQYSHRMEIHIPELHIASDIDDLKLQLIKERL